MDRSSWFRATPGLGRSTRVVLAFVVLVGCGGGSGALAGTWTKTMAGEGDVTMVIKGGTAEIQLPAPRWPADVDMTVKVTASGDSITITEDAGPSACTQPAPKYSFAAQGNQLTVSGGNTDPCGARHAALVGTWTKK